MCYYTTVIRSFFVAPSETGGTFRDEKTVALVENPSLVAPACLRRLALAVSGAKRAEGVDVACLFVVCPWGSVHLGIYDRLDRRTQKRKPKAPLVEFADGFYAAFFDRTSLLRNSYAQSVSSCCIRLDLHDDPGMRNLLRNPSRRETALSISLKFSARIEI